MSDFDRNSLLADEPEESLSDTLQQEINGTRRRIREIQANIEQMQNSVDKQQSRYTSIASELRRLQDNIDTVPREDIRNKYEDALETRFRLATMRGQLEKYQAQEQTLKDQQELLTTVMNQVGFADISPDGDTGVADNGGVSIMRVIQAQEDERQRLARRIHDGPAQSLTNFILQAEICQRLFDRDPEKARDELINLKSNASTTFQKIRDFIFDLRPMMLDDLGVVPTVKRYVEDYRQKNDIETELEILGEEKRLENHQEVLIFRTIQELIRLARDYADPSKVVIRLDITRDPVKIVVEDNGNALDANAVFDPSITSTDARVQGLIMQRDKLELIGGSVTVDSSEDTGTIVRIEIPT